MEAAPLIDGLQWPAAASALAGAWLVGARSARWRRWGFVGFLVSNLLWIAWGAHDRAWALMGVQALFLVTSLRGIRQNAAGAPP